jgi:lipopolysaccharide heptosyltransferase I
LAHDLTSTDFSRILLIKPTALGDVVHTIPVLAKLRRRYPAARIDWLITPQNAELVSAHPALSGIVEFRRRVAGRSAWRGAREYLRLLATLRQNRYDLVIDLQGLLRSAIFTAAAGAPVRIGFDRPVPHAAKAAEGAPRLRHGWSGARELSWLAYNHRLPIETLQVHAIDRYLWLGKLLGFDDSPPDLTLHLPPEKEVVTRELRAATPLAGRPFAVIAPGTMWETKHWRLEGFAEIAGRLQDRGLAVAITGTAGEATLCRQIAEAAPGSVDLSGKTSPAVLAALLREARLCVTNDSGAMHLAVSAGTLVVAIFGPTDPVAVGPYGQAENVVRAGLPCSPCNIRRLRDCPFDLACMRQVTADQVREKVERILSRKDAVPA